MGRVSRTVTEARRQKLRDLLADRTYLPLGEVCAELGVSEATARRDLASLEVRKLIRRTHGGALSPYAGALGDFEAYFPTFDQRRQRHEAVKARLAAAACTLLAPGKTVFIDSGTTCFAIAEHLERVGLPGGTGKGSSGSGARGRGVGGGGGGKNSGVAGSAAWVTVITHNLAVAVKLARVEGVEVHVVGGTLLPRQAGLFGDEACRAVSGRQIDVALMGCEGCDPRGVSNSQKDVVRLQRAAMAASERRVFLLDASKLGVRAPVPLSPWSSVDTLITDATPEQLKTYDLPPARVMHVP